MPDVAASYGKPFDFIAFVELQKHIFGCKWQMCLQVMKGSRMQLRFLRIFIDYNMFETL